MRQIPWSTTIELSAVIYLHANARSILQIAHGSCEHHDRGTEKEGGGVEEGEHVCEQYA